MSPSVYHADFPQPMFPLVRFGQATLALTSLLTTMFGNLEGSCLGMIILAMMTFTAVWTLLTFLLHVCGRLSSAVMIAVTDFAAGTGMIILVASYAYDAGAASSATETSDALIVGLIFSLITAVSFYATSVLGFVVHQEQWMEWTQKHQVTEPHLGVIITPFTKSTPVVV